MARGCKELGYLGSNFGRRYKLNCVFLLIGIRFWEIVINQFLVVVFSVVFIGISLSNLCKLVVVSSNNRKKNLSE